MKNLMVTDLIVAGIACSAYLQYRSFKLIAQMPSRSGNSEQRFDTVKTVEAVVYALLGIIFETSSLAKAFFG